MESQQTWDRSSRRDVLSFFSLGDCGCATPSPDFFFFFLCLFLVSPLLTGLSSSSLLLSVLWGLTASLFTAGYRQRYTLQLRARFVPVVHGVPECMYAHMHTTQCHMYMTVSFMYMKIHVYSTLARLVVKA